MLIIPQSTITLTKGIKNGSTRRRSFRQVTRGAHGNAVLAGRETRQTAGNLDGAVRLREGQIAHHIVVATAGNLAYGFASSRHDG